MGIRWQTAILCTLAALAALLLTACGAATTSQGTQESTPSAISQEATPSPAASYPKTGHAPDYSWVAGQVVVTRIQGGCTFIESDNERFAPNGQGWQSDQVKNGDYVVIFGHIAKEGEPVEICPGGKPYIVDNIMLNP